MIGVNLPPNDVKHLAVPGKPPELYLLSLLFELVRLHLIQDHFPAQIHTQSATLQLATESSTQATALCTKLDTLHNEQLSHASMKSKGMLITRNHILHNSSAAIGFMPAEVPSCCFLSKNSHNDAALQSEEQGAQSTVNPMTMCVQQLSSLCCLHQTLSEPNESLHAMSCL